MKRKTKTVPSETEGHKRCDDNVTIINETQKQQETKGTTKDSCSLSLSGSFACLFETGSVDSLG